MQKEIANLKLENEILKKLQPYSKTMNTELAILAIKKAIEKINGRVDNPSNSFHFLNTI